MNYLYGFNLGIFFDEDEDGLADTLKDVDYNHDGIDDDRRVSFSPKELGKLDPSDPSLPPLLNEHKLFETGGFVTETGGLADLPLPFPYAITFYGPTGCCTTGYCNPNFSFMWRTDRVDGGLDKYVDWDGDCVEGLGAYPVTQLQPWPGTCLGGSPLFPLNVPSGVYLDLNDDCVINKLWGYNDADTFADLPDLRPFGKEMQEFRRNIPRVSPMTSAAEFEDRCDQQWLDRISFDGLSPGTTLTTQYVVSHGVSFVDDEFRTPTVVGSAARSGRPTESPAMSVSNRPVVGADLGEVTLEEGLRSFFTRDGGEGHSEGLRCGPAADQRDARSNFRAGSDLGEDDRHFYFQVTDPDVKNLGYVRISAVVYDDPALLPGTKVKLQYTNNQASGPQDTADVFFTHPTNRSSAAPIPGSPSGG